MPARHCMPVCGARRVSPCYPLAPIRRERTGALSLEHRRAGLLARALQARAPIGNTARGTGTGHSLPIRWRKDHYPIPYRNGGKGVLAELLSEVRFEFSSYLCRCRPNFQRFHLTCAYISVIIQTKVRKQREGGQVFTRQGRRILIAVNAYQADHGYAPTVREIGEMVNLYSPSTVHAHLKTLQERGYITWQPERARTIKATEAGLNQLAEERW